MNKEKILLTEDRASVLLLRDDDSGEMLFSKILICCPEKGLQEYQWSLGAGMMAGYLMTTGVPLSRIKGGQGHMFINTDLLRFAKCQEVVSRVTELTLILKSGAVIKHYVPHQAWCKTPKEPPSCDPLPNGPFSAFNQRCNGVVLFRQP